MKIYTKTGDKGQTSLYDGTRVDKDSLRVDCYGTVDELNSTLGLARNFIEDEEIVKKIYEIQRELFNVAGELATSDGEKFPQRVTEDKITDLEVFIDTLLGRMPKVDQFIIPGSNKGSAALHVARTVCRRAERRIITLSRHEAISSLLMKYVNRLSDTIYAIARYLETELILVNFQK